MGFAPAFATSWTFWLFRHTSIIKQYAIHKLTYIQKTFFLLPSQASFPPFPSHTAIQKLIMIQFFNGREEGKRRKVASDRRTEADGVWAKTGLSQNRQIDYEIGQNRDQETLLEIKIYQILCKINNFAFSYPPAASLPLRSACLFMTSSYTPSPYILPGPISSLCKSIREFIPCFSFPSPSTHSYYSNTLPCCFTCQSRVLRCRRGRHRWWKEETFKEPHHIINLQLEFVFDICGRWSPQAGFCERERE